MFNSVEHYGLSEFADEKSFRKLFEDYFFSHFDTTKQRHEYIDEYYNIMCELLSDIEMGKTRADASKRYEGRGVNVTFTIRLYENLPFCNKAISFTIIEKSGDNDGKT